MIFYKNIQGKIKINKRMLSFKNILNQSNLVIKLKPIKLWKQIKAKKRIRMLILTCSDSGII